MGKRIESIKGNPSTVNDPESGYSTMSGFISSGNIAEAQSFYSDELTEEEEQGANQALAEYLLSDYDRGVKFVSAMLAKTVRSECHYQALYESDPGDGELSLDVCGNELVNLTAQIVFELDKNLEQKDAHKELRISILKKVEAVLDGFIDEDSPNRALLSVYASCVERIEKLARVVYVTPGTFQKYPVCLKKCVRAGRLLVKIDPECERYRKALASYLDLQGDRRVGKSAREFYLEALEQLQIVESAGVASTELQYDLSACYESLGSTYDSSDPIKAREWYLRCLETRLLMIGEDRNNYRDWLFVSPIRKILALKGNSDIAFYERLLAIADKAGYCAPEDIDLQLLINMIVNELLKSTGFEKSESSRLWYEMEAKALERVVAKEQDIPRYFWWLSDSYRGLAEYYTETAPEQSLDFYYKCLDNREQVIKMDGERLCYSCGMRAMLLNINNLVENHAPESKAVWYKRWLSIVKSCRSLCDNQQLFEHKMDMQDLNDKLSKLKK